MPLPINTNNASDHWTRVADNVRQAASNVANAFVGTQTPTTQGTSNTQAQQLFEQQFADLAQDPDAFHATMEQVYGSDYDYDTAESLRQRALSGDFSWLPKVQMVSSETLAGANGAYDAEAGVVYLNEEISPELAAQTYVEEAGHHLDTLLKTTDTAGDEGELFRRILSGENLSKAQIAEIRAENDKGTIYVDGKAVEVEFWNPFKAVADAVSDVVDAVVDVVEDVVDAVVDVVESVGEAIVEFGEGVVNAGKAFVSGVADMTFGFVSNLVQGKFDEAFRSVLKGADKIIFGTTGALVNGAINAGEKLLAAPTYLFGAAGEWFRDEVISRGVDIVRQGFNTAHEVQRDAFRMAYEVPLGFVEDLGKSLGHALKGDWEEAGKRFGLAFANVGSRVVGGVVDSGARILQGAADIGQMAVGQAPASRELNEDEIALLREVYGDSIDYSQVRVKEGGPLNADINGRARVVGNTIYMPSGFGDRPLRNEDGSLTSAGELLIHESGHIWQSQNGGGDYIHQALYGQELGDGYNYEQGINDGKSFDELNPEQQAEYIAHKLGEILARPGDAQENLEEARDSGELTQEEYEYAVQALAMVHAGEGTPEGLW